MAPIIWHQRRHLAPNDAMQWRHLVILGAVGHYTGREVSGGVILRQMAPFGANWSPRRRLRFNRCHLFVKRAR